MPVNAVPLHSSDAPLVGVVMGSDSDWRVMSDASQVLTDFGRPHHVDVVSAHRTPLVVGAAHLPGMLAPVPPLPEKIRRLGESL